MLRTEVSGKAIRYGGRGIMLWRRKEGRVQILPRGEIKRESQHTLHKSCVC